MEGDNIVTCESCGAHFKTTDGGDISQGCPDCGGWIRPYRDQPSPTRSDGTLRNMVDSDSQIDQGGNPLGEGTIMGADGERPVWKRDNYMHSHVVAGWNRFEINPEHQPTIEWYDRGGPEAADDYRKGQLLGFQQHIHQGLVNPNLHANVLEDNYPWGEPRENRIPLENFGGVKVLKGQLPPQMRHLEGDLQGQLPEGEPPIEGSILAALVEAEFSPDLRYVHDGIPCPKCNSLMVPHSTGAVSCPNCEFFQGVGWDEDPEYLRGFRKVPEAFEKGMVPTLVDPPGYLGPPHQGRTADAMEDILGLGEEQQQQQPHFIKWQPGFHGRGLVIGGEPHTWNAYDPATVRGPEDMGPTHSFYVKSLGIQPDLADFNTGVEIRPTGEIELRHGQDPSPYIQADPRLKPLDPAKRQFNYTISMTTHDPYSRTSNMDPYLPWTHEAGPVPPPYSVIAQPGEHGVHGTHHGFLQFLDAHINGEPARQMGADEITRKYGWPTAPAFRQPVTIHVHAPEHIPAIKEQIENGGYEPTPAMIALMGRMKSGEIPPPPGVQFNQPPQEALVAHTGGFAAPLIEGAGALLGGEGMLGKVAPALMKGALFRAGENAVGAGKGGGPEGLVDQGVYPNEDVMANVAAILVSKGYETPSSNPDVGTKHGDDPEKVDQKEFNDQDKNPSNPHNPNLEDSGASGEDDVREHAGFAPDSPGLERLNLLLPLVTHYFHSEESGEDDPMLHQLHELLEAENPGYLDRVEPEHEQEAHEFIKQLGKKPHGVHANNKTSILGGDPNDMTQMLQNMVAPQGVVPSPPGGQQHQGSCPSCGGVLTGDGSCPQCGQKMGPGGALQQQPGMMSTPGGMGAFAHTDILAALFDSANHQGPVTPEQIAAVQQLLIQQGRIDELPNVPIKPEDYAKEMAQIQGNPNVAPQVSPEEQTQPPPPQMAPPGGMPMPGMGSEPGGQPMQPMAHHANGDEKPLVPEKHDHTSFPANDTVENHDCFDHAVPFEYEDVHGWKCSLCNKLLHTGKVAADNIARRCPKCNSATTGMLNENGEMGCHSCGNIWKHPGAIKDETTSRVALDGTPELNPVEAPAADRHQPHDLEGQQDSSLTWKDTDGQQLLPKQEYEMHSPSYSLPDMIRVEHIKPDGLDVTLLGTYANEAEALQAPAHVSREDMELEHITFTPVADSQEERGNEPPPGSQTPGHEQVPPTGPTTDEHENSFPTSAVVSSLVDVPEAVDDDSCPKCGYRVFESSMSSPTSIMNECFRCAHVWETKDELPGFDVNASAREWINEGDMDDDFFAGMERAQAMRSAGTSSRDLGSIAARDERKKQIKNYLDNEASERTAGRKFTPREQKELIDEDGVARNSDLLDLQGTHYEARADWSGKANAENVPDEHLIMGI